MKKFTGYIEDEWLEHRANMKCFKPIKGYHLSPTANSTVLYIFYEPFIHPTKEGWRYPETYIKTSLN